MELLQNRHFTNDAHRRSVGASAHKLFLGRHSDILAEVERLQLDEQPI
jgi:hypothetical protein